MRSMLMDVFCVLDNVVGFTCSYLNVVRGWDGQLYAETNLKEIAGPNRLIMVDGYGRIPRTLDHRFNCGNGDPILHDLARM